MYRSISETAAMKKWCMNRLRPGRLATGKKRGLCFDVLELSGVEWINHIA
jgi:hypothetical protein